MALLPALLGGAPPPPQPVAPAPLAPPPVAGAPALAHVLDHVAQAQARLLTQYKDKPQFLGLVAATFGSGYKLGGAWVQPAAGFSRTIKFLNFGNGSTWTETARTAADVPN